MNFVGLLVKHGVLKEADLPCFLDVLKNSGGKPPHIVVVEQNFAKEEDVLPILASQFGMDLVDLAKATISPEVIRVMPNKLVHRKSLMPIVRDNGTLTVATGDPFDLHSLDELQTLTGLQIHPVLGLPREINRLIKTHFGVGGETVTAMVQQRTDGVELLEEIEADDSEIAKQAQEASVVRLVNEILVEAANERASDIHVEPEETSLRIRYRIDGILQSQKTSARDFTFSERDHQPYQNHGSAQHRGETPPSRRPHQNMRVNNREIDVRIFPSFP